MFSKGRGITLRPFYFPAMLVPVFSVMILAACLAASSQYADTRVKVTFPDKTVVMAELAATPQAREKGLMMRKSLGPTEGMVFVFEQPGFYPFWMQNCVIGLDIIWLDTAFRVVSIAENVPPCRLANCEPPCASNDCPTYPPRVGTEAKYVIEVQAGFAKAHALTTGARIDVAFPPSTSARVR